MQACAAVGQSLLMHTYEQLFFGKKVVAQLLLSSDDFTSPIRYRNLQNALHELLKLGVVPVVNENDSVSVRELVGAFGDNDELSALLATAVKADWLLLLTDVDGFYVPNGKRPRLLRTVRKLTPPHGSASATARASWAREACAPSCVPPSWPAKRAPTSPSSTDGIAHAIPWALERKIGTYFPPSAESLPMATSVRTPSSTRDKLLRARKAPRPAGAAHDCREERASCWRWRTRLQANAAKFSKRTRRTWTTPDSPARCATGFLLTPERIAAMVAGVREVARPARSSR